MNRSRATTTPTPSLAPVERRAPVRWDLVRRVRREIARGEYETPERLRVTVERLLEALGG